jgi:hypothetical protein
MPCDHLGPPDVIELAERDLRARGAADGSDAAYRHGENTPGGMWASVVIEIERRGREWIVTRLDRNREPLPAGEVGLARI